LVSGRDARHRCGTGLSPIYFDPTGTLPSRSSIPSSQQASARGEIIEYDNVNSKTLKSIEEIATAVAIVHNLVRIGRGEVIPT
jgi:hypothetical protein